MCILFIGRLTVWLANWMSPRKHCLSYAVYDLHKEYGDFVRISPDQISISHPSSIKVSFMYLHVLGKNLYIMILLTRKLTACTGPWKRIREIGLLLRL